MLHSPRQIRLALFIVAGLLSLAATYIRFADLLPLEPLALAEVEASRGYLEQLRDALSGESIQGTVSQTSV